MKEGLKSLIWLRDNSNKTRDISLVLNEDIDSALGFVVNFGCTDGIWWVISNSSENNHIPTLREQNLVKGFRDILVWQK